MMWVPSISAPVSNSGSDLAGLLLSKFRLS